MKKKANYILQEEEKLHLSKRSIKKYNQIFFTKSNFSSSLKTFLKVYKDKKTFYGPYSDSYSHLKFKLTNFEGDIKNIENDLVYIARMSKLFDHTNSINLIFNVLLYRKYWKNELKNWRPRTYNRQKQETDLLQYLFETYRGCSPFFYNFWLEGDEQKERFDRNRNNRIYHRAVHNDLYRKLYIEIGEGKSLRKTDTAKEIFIPGLEITKKFAYYFNQVPENYTSIDAASLFCVLKICHVPDSLIRYIVNSDKIQNLLQNYDFWKDVWAFFRINPMINPSQLEPIIDFIYNKKFNEGEDFRIKNRNPLNLLEEIDQWHRKLIEKVTPKIDWKGVDVKNYEPLKENPASLETFTITQILDSYDLKLEGKTLHHCVYSYLSSCVNGHLSIWSYKENGVRTLTIALNKNEITQIRGTCNRMMQSKEREKIMKWVNENKLKISII